MGKYFFVVLIFAFSMIACSDLSSSKEDDNLNWVSNVVVSTWSGGEAGYTDGNLSEAQFKNPSSIDIDENQNIYVADFNNFILRKITYEGQVTTWFGEYPEAGDPITFWPSMLAVGLNEEIFVIPPGGYQIYRVTQDNMHVFAGNIKGDVDGSKENARFSTLQGLVVASDGTIYVSMGVFADESHKIKKISPDGMVETLAGSDVIGHKDGTGIEAKFHSPHGLALSPNEDVLYVASSWTIRTIDLSNGMVSTLTGIYQEDDKFSWRNIDGPLDIAQFTGDLMGIAVSNEGVIYVSNSTYNIIRRISTNGIVSTVAGQVSPGGGNKNGSGKNAEFNFPRDLTIDSNGNLFIADFYNNSIRKISFQ